MSMTKTQKLAALLTILGTDAAAQVLKGLDDENLEAVVLELGRMKTVTPEAQTEVLSEFADLALDAGTTLSAGFDFAKTALERALGQPKAASIMNRVAPEIEASPVSRRIGNLEPRQICNLIKHEQAQTIALILSYLPADQASQILSMLETEKREETVERLANLGPTSAEVIHRVIAVLEKKVGELHASALRKTGGLKSAAEVLNALDKKSSESLLSNIEKRRPDLGQAIRRKMFTFEDLAKLEASELRKVLREVDTRDLAMALKPANDEVRAVFFGCISKRAAESLNEEISFLTSLKPRDAEAARDRIIDVVRRLEAEGEIELGQGGESEHEAIA